MDLSAQNRILVTGSTGFIGKNLIPRLEECGYIVYPVAKSLGFDLCNDSSLDLFLNKGISTIFHLAGKTYVPDSWNTTSSFYEINSLGTQRVLEFCRRTNAKLIYVSAYVYGVPRYLPIDESHPVMPNNPYAHSKWIGEELCKFYAREMGVKSIILRPFNLYGPGQAEHFLIPTLIKQIKENLDIVVKDETPKRDYLYISDFVDACILAINYDEDFRIFNIGAGYSISVREIIETLIQYSHKQIKWRSLGEKRKNEILDTIADCSAIKQSLNWSPKIQLKEFIANCINLENS